MIVGPSAIGKSTLMNEMVRMRDDFAYVRSFTTRSKRPGEASYYDFITRDQALTIRENDEAITYVEHPTTHDLYGTTVASYPKRYNLLDTLSGSVVKYRSLPFKSTITIAVTAEPNEWRQWFLSRYPEPSPEAEKRLIEAKSSIEWALEDSSTYWVVNTPSNPQQGAKHIIDIVTEPNFAVTAPHEMPYAMLKLIEEGIWPKK